MRINKPTDTLLAVAKIGELVTKPLDTSNVLMQIVTITADIMKVDVCSIYLYDRDNDTLVLEATIGLKDDAIGRVRINYGEGITGRAAKQGRTVAVSDVTRDKRNKYIPITGEEDYRSLLSVPLKFMDEIIGVINVQTTKPRTFVKHERRLLNTIAHQVSGLIRNTRLYESVIATNHKLKVTQEKLDQSEKMAALGRLAATLSHEIRNPLAGLKGATQLLMKKTLPSDERRQYINLILDEVGRLGRIVDDLLLFAHPRTLKYTTVDANRIIEDTLLLISTRLESSEIKTHNRLSKLPFIRADDDKYTQVIVNILLNALDAMPDGGDLFVSSSVVRRDPDGAEFAVFQFRDTGTGIDDDVLRQVYEPFYTTKASGVGLGLAVCKTIVEEHGGSISILSRSTKEDHGTLVTVEFPVSEPQK